MEEQQEEGKKLCNNCGQHISEANFVLHELRCAKHTAVCQHCNQPVPREEMEQHYEEEHAPETCQHCGSQFPKEEIEDHIDSTCPEVKLQCKYCELDVLRKEHTEHTEMCGSRTDVCDLCSQRVRLRDMDEHKATKCTYGTNASNGTPRQQPYQGLDREGFFGSPDVLFGTAQSLIGMFSHHPGLAHPFVPQPAKPVAIPAHHSVADQAVPYHKESKAPLPSSDHSSDLQVDPQWLASVKGACGEENLDQVLAQNMFANDYRRRSPSYSPPRSYSQPNGREKGIDEDAALALKMQQAEQEREHHFVSSGVQSKSVGGGMDLASMEERDAELARRIHERDKAYAERQRKDMELAERLQAEERQWVVQGLEGGFGGNGYHGDNVYGEPAGDYQRRPLHDRSSYQHPWGDEEAPYMAQQQELEENHTFDEYNAGVLDNEDPRPKTPPPSQDTADIPCEYCNELYPFERILDHQSRCRVTKRGPNYPSSTQFTESEEWHFTERETALNGEEGYMEPSTGVRHHQPSCVAVPLSRGRQNYSPPSHGGQNYSPPSHGGQSYHFSSSKFSRSYHSSSSGGSPPPDRQQSHYLTSRGTSDRGQIRYPPSGGGKSYQPTSRRTFDEEESQYSLSSGGGSYYQSSSRGQSEGQSQYSSSSGGGSYHQSSSKGQSASSSVGQSHQPTPAVSSRRAPQTHQPLAAKTAALRDQHSGGGKEGGVVLTDDFLKKISANSNKETSALTVTKQLVCGPCGPCEVCGELLPVQKLVKHEEICRHRQRKKTVTASSSSAVSHKGETRATRKAAAGDAKDSGSRASSVRSKPLGGDSRRQELSVEGLRVDPIQHTRYQPHRSYTGDIRPVTKTASDPSSPSGTQSLRKIQDRAERSRAKNSPKLPVGDGWIVEGTKMTSEQNVSHAQQGKKGHSYMTSDEVSAALFD